MKAIIVDTKTDGIDAVGWRRELLDWAGSLGLDTKRATATFVLIESRHAWRACFSLKRQRDGHDYVDPRTGRLAVDYGCARFDIPHGSWPRWFGEPMDLPDMDPGHLLDILAAAEDAAVAMKSAAWHKANPAEVVS